MNFHKYCEEKVKASGSSFYYSFIFLNEKQRKAINAVYAFCREVDDIADEILEKDIALHKLNFWKEEIEKIYNPQKRPNHPIALAIEEALNDFDLEKQHFLDLIQGMVYDVHYQGYQNLEDTEQYCYCVASTVGLLSIEIFGYKDAKTKDFALNCGKAMQWINILRDIKEDAIRGRIYIPESELNKYNVTADSILQLKKSPNLKKLLISLDDRASDYYQKALDSLTITEKTNQVPSLIMSSIYLENLNLIRKNDYNVLEKRIRVPLYKKIFIAWREMFKHKFTKS